MKRAYITTLVLLVLFNMVIWPLVYFTPQHKTLATPYPQPEKGKVYNSLEQYIEECNPIETYDDRNTNLPHTWYCFNDLPRNHIHIVYN